MSYIVLNQFLNVENDRENLFEKGPNSPWNYVNSQAPYPTPRKINMERMSPYQYSPASEDEKIKGVNNIKIDKQLEFSE